MTRDPRPATTGPIEHISDTARWVAMYRAFESERPDARFSDPYARRLAGARGEEIVRRMPRGLSMGWPMVVRTCLFDEIVMRRVRDPGLGVVLNLAAGLDARPWRLELPAALRWVDVDLPEILEHKRALLEGERPSCRYQAEALDLRDAAARRERLGALVRGASPGLAMSEGLLVYLEPDEVAALARDLHDLAELRWWIIDLASPALLRWMERSWGRVTASGGAPFRFAPAEGTLFFAAHGWKEAEFRSTWEEARRLRREMPLAWFWRFIARFAPRAQREQWRRFSGTVLLERT